MRLHVDIDNEQLLDTIACELREHPLLGATGIGWSHSDVLRFLLRRALDTWPLLGPQGQTSTADRVPMTTMEDGLSPGLSDGDRDRLEAALSKVTKGEERGGDEPDELDEEPDELPRSYKRLPHWDYFDHDGPWEIPPEQNKVHAYYKKAGWIRLGIPLDDRMLDAYWTPLRADQEALDIYPEQDGHDRWVISQRAPDVGIAHIVPEGWGTDFGPEAHTIIFGGN